MLPIAHRDFYCDRCCCAWLAACQTATATPVIMAQCYGLTALTLPTLSAALLANICEKGTSVRLLKREQKRRSNVRSRIRSRVEHVFGRISQFGGGYFRRIGIRRCKFETALTNLIYNLDRFAMFHA